MKKIFLTLAAFTFFTVVAFAQKNKIKIETEYGNIVLTLYDNTPLNTENMVTQAKAHTYDSTLFHRVIPEFMIQGGDPTSKRAAPGQTLGSGGLSFTVPAEINDQNFHKRGAVGVARDGNPTKAGNACQFYLVVGKKFTDAELDNMAQRGGRKFTPEQREAYKTIGGAPFLDGGYTVFGEVTEGMDIVDKIALEPRNSSDRPDKDIRMISVTVMKKKKKFLFF